MLYLVIANLIFYASTAVFYPYLQVLLRNNGYSYSLVGIILALGDAAAVVIPLFVAAWADKSGKRYFGIFIATMLTVLFYVPLALSTKLVITIISICISRGFIGCVNPLIESISTTYFNGDSQKFSITRTMGSLGYVICALVIGIFSIIKTDSNVSMLIGFSIPMVVYSFYSLIFLRKVGPSARIQLIKTGKIPEIKKIEQEDKFVDGYKKAFIIVIVLYFFQSFASTAIERFLSSYMVEVMGLGDKFIVFTAIGVISEIFMMLAAGALIKKKIFPPKSFMLLGAIAMVIRLGIYSMNPSLFAFVMAQILHGFTFGSFYIAGLQIIFSIVPRQHSSFALGIYNSIGSSLPMVIAATLGGFIIDHFGFSALFTSYSFIAVIEIVLLLIFGKHLSQD